MKTHIIAAFITALVLSVPAFSYTKSVDKSTQSNTVSTELLAKYEKQQQSKNVKEVMKPTPIMLARSSSCGTRGCAS